MDPQADSRPFSWDKEEQWIKAGVKLIAEIGPEVYLKRLLAALRRSVEPKY